MSFAARALVLASLGLELLVMELSKLLTVGNAIKVMLLFGVFALFGVIVQSCNGPKSAGRM